MPSDSALTDSKVVADNDVYRIEDYLIPEIEPLTLSLTVLKPGKSTKGHSHPSPEIYCFLSDCKVMLGKDKDHLDTFSVSGGQMLLVKDEQFHRVAAWLGMEARFVSVFLGSRDSRNARYG